jgi:hypothetical protein
VVELAREIPEKFRKVPPEIEEALKEIERGERPLPVIKVGKPAERARGFLE